MGKRARRIRQLRKLGVEPPARPEYVITVVGSIGFVSNTWTIGLLRRAKVEQRERPLTGEELQAFWPGRKT